MKELKELTWEIIKANLEESYHLYYVDYNDNLDEFSEQLQQAIQDGNFDAITDTLWESWTGYVDLSYEIEELKDKLEKLGYDLSNFDEFQEDIEQAMYDRDNSDVFGDLLKNTSSTPIFFSLNYYVEDELNDGVKSEVRKIKKVLGINSNKYDKDLFDLINNRCYGGELGFFALPDIEDLMDNKPMRFTGNVVLAIVNYGNGSGYHIRLEDFTSRYFVFNKNIFIDKTFKYNYSFEVCGMYSDWCKDSELDITAPTKRHKIIYIEPNENMLSSIKTEGHYKQVFEQGSCSFGDMDMKRHRHVEYTNNYPCGSRCKDCGTFWID